MTNRNFRMRPQRLRPFSDSLKRAVFVGCRFCGATDVTLRRFGDGYICPACLDREQGKEDHHDQDS